jgi:hypothetical protein
MPSTKKRPKGVRKLMLAGAPTMATVAGVGALPDAAEASASGCTYGGRPVDRCVYVNGSSTYVNYIEGTIRYHTGQHLQIEVWGDGIYYRGYGNIQSPSAVQSARQ